MAPANTGISKLPKRFELPFATPCNPLQSITNRLISHQQNHAQISQTRISGSTEIIACSTAEKSSAQNLASKQVATSTSQSKHLARLKFPRPPTTKIFLDKHKNHPVTFDPT